jgi:hypothetical protein
MAASQIEKLFTNKASWFAAAPPKERRLELLEPLEAKAKRACDLVDQRIAHRDTYIRPRKRHLNFSEALSARVRFRIFRRSRPSAALL